jgi:RNA polymerase subunit RPABC4/transcription elongation factor Spt4
MRAHLESVKKAQEAAAAMAARGGAAGPVFCPSCRREFPGQTTFCPFDSNRLVAVAGHENLMIGPAGGICPTCKRGFNPGVKVCPHDGDELVPPAMISALAAQAGAPAHAPNPAPPRGKICPTCGGRFDGMAAFCGKDGTQLVLLN